MITDLNAPESQAVLQETRLRILALLSGAQAQRREGFSLQELGRFLECSPQNVHHHLRILAEVGVVRVARTEATQRIPRQFWVSDIHRICLRAADGGDVEIDTAIPLKIAQRLERDLEAWAAETPYGPAVEEALRFGHLLGGLGADDATKVLEILREHFAKK